MDPIHIPQMLAYIPAPWIRHGIETGKPQNPIFRIRWTWTQYRFLFCANRWINTTSILLGVFRPIDHHDKWDVNWFNVRNNLEWSCPETDYTPFGKRLHNYE
jgi:hypothetical protein